MSPFDGGDWLTQPKCQLDLLQIVRGKGQQMSSHARLSTHFGEP